MFSGNKYFSAGTTGDARRYRKQLRFECMESRHLLTAVTISDYEQLLVELINRARMDPLAEVASNEDVNDLNDNLDPGTITAGAKQPLATVQILSDAAAAHAQDMLDRGYFAHDNPEGESPTDRAANLGYARSVAENIAFDGTTGRLDELEVTISSHDGLFTSAGHRRNLLKDSWVVIGVGIRFGDFAYNERPDVVYDHSAMVAEGFARDNEHYVTGVVYDDALIDDDFYSVGEGHEGIVITAIETTSNQQYSTVTGRSGGYNIALPDGTYEISAHFQGQDFVLSEIVMAGSNVKVDFDTSSVVTRTVGTPHVVVMTDHEQLLVELINRARMDPLGELSHHSYVDDLNYRLEPGTISSAPKQPLATVSSLVVSSVDQTIDMLSRNTDVQFNANGDTPTERANAAGYPGGVNELTTVIGGSHSTDWDQTIDVAHNRSFYSHRELILDDSYEEIGIGVRFGEYTTDTQDYENAAGVAKAFGHSIHKYVTGVVFDDAVVDDDFYSVGEGVEGVAITAIDANGNVFATITGPSGGYNIQLLDGSYSIIASLDGRRYLLDEVTIGGANVKVDLDTSALPAPLPNYEDILGYRLSGDLWVGASDSQRFQTGYSGSWSSWDSMEFLGVGDFNGDGFDDIAGQSNGTIVVGISNPTMTGTTFVSHKWGSFSTNPSWVLKIGDFNGDGMDDILGRESLGGTLWLWSSTGSRFQTSYRGTISTAVGWTDYLVGNFNGDDRDELAARASDGSWWIMRDNGSRTVSSYWGRWSPNVTWSDVDVGDFNGDGLDDISGRANNAYWYVNLSTGSRFSIQHWGTWSSTVAWKDVRVGDFNGDGRTDIAGRANGAWWIAESNGARFVNRYWGAWSTAIGWHDVTVVDINGDGNDDLVGRTDSGDWWASISTGSRFDTKFVERWSAAGWDFVVAGDFV